VDVLERDSETVEDSWTHRVQHSLPVRHQFHHQHFRRSYRRNRALRRSYRSLCYRYLLFRFPGQSLSLTLCLCVTCYVYIGCNVSIYIYICMNVSCMHVCVTSMKYVFMCEFSELLSFTFSMKELKIDK
jgi:hypothetical protein